MTRQAVLITAGHKRIGAMLSRICASNGYDLAIHYFSDFDAAQRLQLDIQTTYGVHVEVFQADLRNLDDTTRLMHSVCDAFPRLSFLINNAASFIKIPFVKETVASMCEQLTLNLLSPVVLTQIFSKHVDSGHVLMIVDAKKFYEDRVVYGTSKQALESFVMQSARSLAPSIRVNAIALGWMLPSEGGYAYPGDDVLLQRSGTEQDLMNAVSFLDQSSYVTGEILHIDGGRHLG